MAKLELHPEQYEIGRLLNYTQIQGFTIPDFQRPYAWKTEHCQQLWEDVYGSYKSAKSDNANCDQSYFLGSIIAYPNDPNENNLIVIDGQQRITTLLLLLRAIYTVCENKFSIASDTNYKNALLNIQKDLEKMLYTPKSIFGSNEYDKSQPRIKRLNTINGDNDFNHIMQTGKIIAADGNTEYSPSDILEQYTRLKNNNKSIIKDKSLDCILKSNECINYALFYEIIRELDANELKEIVFYISNLCFILLIKTKSVESSLDIFNILNNRGMQLSDSDIFKNIIFKNLKSKSNETTPSEQWQELLKILSTDPPIELQLDQLFRLYMFAIRMAHSTADKSKEPKMRTFFTKDFLGIKFINNPNVIQELKSIALFIFNVIAPDYDNTICNDFPDISIDDDVRYDITLLQKYLGNLSWLNLIASYWYCYHNNAKTSPNQFNSGFKKYIRYCTSALFLKSILIGKSSDADIPQLGEKLSKYAATQGVIEDFNIYFTSSPSQQLNDIVIKNRKILDGESCTEHIEMAQNALKGDTSKLNHLVLLYAYLFKNKNSHKKQPILQSMTIEHILPQKWEAHYGTQWRSECANDDEINEYVEHLGNKIILARERNIWASARDFQAKLRAYSDDKCSNVRRTLELDAFIKSHRNSKLWRKCDVDKRTKRMITEILDYIQSGIEGGIA